jgi:hypothetical protein
MPAALTASYGWVKVVLTLRRTTVKLHKPFFVGRSAIIATMQINPMMVIRFRMNETLS